MSGDRAVERANRAAIWTSKRSRRSVRISGLSNEATPEEIVKENKLSPELPDDLTALIRKSVLVRKHIEENSKDETAKRGLTLTESKIKRLVKYFKRTGKLKSEWKFDPARAGFFMK